jgi:hypothetical protein
MRYFFPDFPPCNTHLDDSQVDHPLDLTRVQPEAMAAWLVLKCLDQREMPKAAAANKLC